LPLFASDDLKKIKAWVVPPAVLYLHQRGPKAGWIQVRTLAGQRGWIRTATAKHLQWLRFSQTDRAD
jgi:hypothetical protein